MDAFLATLHAALQRWDLHPVIDHFSVSLLIVGVAIDLVAGVAPTRIWLRYTALTLIILGALAAGGSYFTGGIEADRVWDTMSPAAKAVLHWHATLGLYLAITFGVLAVWRILLQAVGSFGGTRPIYLIVAVVAAGVLLYSGSLGGELVYTYGVGTLLTGPAPSVLQPRSSTTTPTLANEALPTVTVPTSTVAIATPTPVMATPVAATYTPSASPTP